MKGKAQLILTDPDSGRVVKQVEESNMVTNAIQKIFDIPRQGILRGNPGDIYNGFMPFYKYLMSGLVMLENNVDENPDNFMIPDDAIYVGSAGTAYTGTMPKRGTLNASQSGTIDNGYRFVWDFAPEKAVGTIRCIGLTNRWFGDTGIDREKSDGRVLMNPQYLYSVDSGTRVECFTTKGSVLGYLDGDQTMYSSKVYGNKVYIYRQRFPNYNSIKLSDTIDNFKNMQLISTEEYTLPFSAYDYKSWAFDKANRLLYVFNVSYYSSTKCETVKYCAIDVKTGVLKREGSFEWTPKQHSPTIYFGASGNKIYVSEYGEIAIYSMSGEQMEFISLGDVYSAMPMFSEGKKYMLVYDSVIGRFFLTHLGHEPMAYIESPNMAQRLDFMNLPYVLTHSPTAYDSVTSYIMLRTDYLATINNLAEPLVKTDRHALQVRYEITND